MSTHMPIYYAVDNMLRRLVARAHGMLTFQDINAHLDVEERNRHLSLPELFDARNATTDLTGDQVQHLVERAVSALRTVDLGPTAIVTTNEPGQTVMSARLGPAYKGFGLGTTFQGGQMRIVAYEKQAKLRTLAGKRIRLHLAVHDWAGNTKVIDRFFTVAR